jgi:hypothetical protein
LLRFALTLSRRRRQQRDLSEHAGKQLAGQVTLRQQQPVVARVFDESSARTLKLPELMRDVWLVPFKDLVMAAIWAVSLVGHEVAWGGRRFTISRDGVMREIADG